MSKKKFDQEHPAVKQAINNVTRIIDDIKPNELVSIIKQTPSLRGIVAGNIAELRFRQFAETHEQFSDFYKPDDHDRSENKIDLRFVYKKHAVTVQLKSIQTGSIRWNIASQTLECKVQNDGSDKREINLPNGHKIETTNYKFGDYDILAVPLFPFTGKWDFCYLLNEDCSHSTAKKYAACDKQYLIATTETLTYPLSGKWTDNIFTAIGELFRRRGINL